MKRVDQITKIDTPDLAYIAGFILGDGYISKTNYVEITTKLEDKEIPYFIAEQLDGKYSENLTTNKQQKKFPSASCIIYSKHFNNFLKMLYGGRLKEERRVPILKEELEDLFLHGFFDAEGCITWGYRKDRNRIWQKVSFTSSLSILTGIQKILLKKGISSIIRPKKNENCFIIEFSNELDVYNFFDKCLSEECYLDRKIVNFNRWINATKKKYSFNIGDVVTFVDPRTCKKYGLPTDLYKKGKYKILNMTNNEQFVLIENVWCPTIVVSKEGISNIALRLELGEFGGFPRIPSRALDKSEEGVETTGEVNLLNNRDSAQAQEYIS